MNLLQKKLLTIVLGVAVATTTSLFSWEGYTYECTNGQENYDLVISFETGNLGLKRSYIRQYNLYVNRIGNNEKDLIQSARINGIPKAIFNGKKSNRNQAEVYDYDQYGNFSKTENTGNNPEKLTVITYTGSTMNEIVRCYKNYN